MKAIRLTVKHDEERHPRTFLIVDNTAGGIEILREGAPRSDGDRSVCIHLDRGDVILAVELVSP